MSKRTYARNAFETTLAATLNAGVYTATLVSGVGLIYEDYYFAIEPDNLDNVEFVKVDSVTDEIVTFVNDPAGAGRALPGSANPIQGGVEHLAGAIVRSIPIAQVQEDIFDDIEALEATVAAIPGLYVDVTGDTMTGPLTLSTTAPSANAEAAAKAYVDVQSAAAQSNAEIASDARDDTQDTAASDHEAGAGSHGVKDDTNPHNHDRYTDLEAQDAVGFEDIYVKTAGGDTITGDLTVEEIIRTDHLQAEAPGHDLALRDGAGATIMLWDDSDDELEMKHTVDMENHILKSPLDPTNGAHVGDRNYNDVRYPVLTAGAMGTTTPYACDVYASVTQLLPDADWVVLNMNVERYDPHADFNLSTEKYTVAKTGMYMFGASFRMNAADITNLRVSVEHISGASYETQTFPDGVEDSPMISVFGMRYMTPGEWIRPRAYQDSPGSRSTRANTTRFWAGRLS